MWQRDKRTISIVSYYTRCNKSHSWKRNSVLFLIYCKNQFRKVASFYLIVFIFRMNINIYIYPISQFVVTITQFKNHNFDRILTNKWLAIRKILYQNIKIGNNLKIANFELGHQTMNDVIDTHVSTGIKERNLLEILESKSTMQAGNIECIREMIHYCEKRGDFAMDVDIKVLLSVFSNRG